MPPIYTIQPTFTGGEIAPGLQGRVDLAKYSTGLNKCVNGLIHPQGGVSNRSGFKYIAKPKYAEKRCRLIGFEYSATQSYIIEMGEYYARFFLNQSQLAVSTAPAWVTATAYEPGDFVTHSGTIYYCVNFHTSGVFATDLAGFMWIVQSVYEVVLPYTQYELPKLKFTQSVDVLYITHPDHPPMTLTRYDHTDWRLVEFPFILGPMMPDNLTSTTLASAVTAKGTSGLLVASTGIFTADHVGSLFAIDHDFPSQTVSGSFGANGSSSSVTATGAWRLITHGTWTGKITVEKSTNGGGAWVEVRSFTSSNDFNPNTFGTDDTEGSGALFRVTMSGYSSGTCNYDLTLDACTVHGIVEVTGYTNATTVGIIVVQQVGKTTAVTSWAEGSWSDVRGWPSSVAFIEDRLGFAGTDTEPQTVWLSKTGEYVNFGISDPLVDSDSISVNLPSRKLNRIDTLAAIGDLLGLTRSGEWRVGAAGGEPITPSTINPKQQGSRGSNGVDIVTVGNRGIYVQPQGTVVRDIGFDFSSDSYTGDDISLISSHLFTGYEITALCYQQEPDSLVWAIRNDGVLLSATYVREQQVLAWSQHNTQGLFEDVATIPGDGYDQLWVVVNRTNGRFIEVQTERMVSTEPEDQFFMDCGITAHGGAKLSKVSAISGDAYVIKIAAEASALINGDVVTMTGLETFSELNGNTYRVAGPSATIGLYDYWTLLDVNTGIPVVYSRMIFGTENSLDMSPPLDFLPDAYALIPIQTITGLDHLEGQEVTIMADGKDLPNMQVSGGQIELPDEASIIHVGLPYTFDVETLRLEIASREGTLQGRNSRVPSAKVRFLNTRGGLLGSDVDHLYDVEPELQKLINIETPKALLSGDVKCIIASDWDNGGRLYFRQSRPLPATILAFMPDLSVGG